MYKVLKLQKDAPNNGTKDEDIKASKRVLTNIL